MRNNLNGTDFLDSVFYKSKKQNGYIYLCKTYIKERYKPINGEISIRDVTVYKYGKTKDIKKRMQFYGDKYKLIECWEVNHLSLREEFIRKHPYIAQDRREEMKDERDEHVHFNCYDIVKDYATADVDLKKDTVYFYHTKDKEQYSASTKTVLYSILHL